MTLDRATAKVYSRGFASLGDPTRMLVLHTLASGGRPMSVGEVVEGVDVGQSTVSHHLKLLEEVGFVVAERRGTKTYFHVNESCLQCFPSAAALVMGQLPPLEHRRLSKAVLPWLEEAKEA